MSVLRTAVLLLLRRRVRQDLWWEWRRRWRGPPRLPGGPIRSILVVCQGNICRSPFVEALLRRRLPETAVRSAGLGAAEDEGADPTAARIAREFGVSLQEHRTHRVARTELEGADLILVMQGHHASEILRLEPSARERLRLVGDFLDAPPYGVEDPWGRDEETFRRIFRRLERATSRILLPPSEPASTTGNTRATGRSREAETR